MSTDRKELGNFGEQLVARWYEKHGFQIVDRQWRSRAGEIDIVAKRLALVVFCEVKTRRSAAFGTPAEAVDWRKQMKIRKVAMDWLRSHECRGMEIRFDVACVFPAGKQKKFSCQVITNAF